MLYGDYIEYLEEETTQHVAGRSLSGAQAQLIAIQVLLRRLSLEPSLHFAGFMAS
jgi:hypothetical protein